MYLAQKIDILDPIPLCHALSSFVLDPAPPCQTPKSDKLSGEDDVLSR